MRQIGGVGRGSITVHLLKRLGDSGVQPYPPGEQKLLGQCIVYQRVGEPVPAHRVRNLLYHLRRQRLLQNFKQRIFRQSLP